MGKGLLDEVSKEVAGKVNYDGLLISTSLIDKGNNNNNNNNNKRMFCVSTFT